MIVDEDLEADGDGVPRRVVVAGAAAAVVGGAGVVSAIAKAVSPGDAPAAENAAGQTSVDLPAPVDDLTTTTTVPRARSSDAASAPQAGQVVSAVPTGPLDRPHAAHLLRRATFGPTGGAIEEASALGLHGWLARQLALARSDSGMVHRLDGFITLDWSARRRAADARENDRSHVAPTEIAYATVLHAAYSEHQLREVMLDFWCNHFHTDLEMGSIRYTKADEVRLFRRHALGRFADLLAASAQSPSMLMYLDNQRSRHPEPNENYGRELLELHTVGVDGGYGEDDVLNAARVFTGWTVKDLEFRFVADWHDPDPVRVLGWSADGSARPKAVEQGRSLLAYLARHPSTARHVTAKLVDRFVGPVSTDLVDRLAAVYLDHDTAIGPVLHALFTSEEFWRSSEAKVRRPFDVVVAALRATGARLATPPFPDGGISGAMGAVDEVGPLVPGVGGPFPETSASRPPGYVAASAIGWALRRMGQPLFTFGDPTGFGEDVTDWIHTQGLQARWEQLGRLAQADSAAIRFDRRPITRGATTAAGLTEAVSDALLFRSPTDEEVAALVAATGLGPDDPIPARQRDGVVRLLVGLVLSSPGFQVR